MHFSWCSFSGQEYVLNASKDGGLEMNTEWTKYMSSHLGVGQDHDAPLGNKLLEIMTE
jgi:hypothetical protein